MKEIKLRLVNAGHVIGYEWLSETGWKYLLLNNNTECDGVFPDKDFGHKTPLRRDQSTGVKDKHGNEIYGLDKVKRRVYLVERGQDYMDYNCIVKWDKWCYCLHLHDKRVWGLDPITAREVEVTGVYTDKYELTTNK